MVAAVKIHEMTGSRVGFDKTSGRIRFEDSNATIVDRDNRLQVPSAGTNYSFTKQIRCFVATPPSIDLQNFAAYSDGANDFGTGIDVEYDTVATTLGAAFRTATRTDITGSTFFTATSLTAIDLTQNIASSEFAGTGYKAKILRMQMSVANTAAAGSLDGESLTIKYDES